MSDIDGVGVGFLGSAAGDTVVAQELDTLTPHDVHRFTFRDVATVTALSPASGSTDGATIVTVSGSNFANSSSLRCHFGGLPPSPATFVSPELITCASPSAGRSRSPRRVAVEVSDDGNTQRPSVSNFF